jgi:hypothetical protein
MKIDIISIAYFQRRFKRLVKKFRTLDDEFDKLIDGLEADPTLGKSLGSGLYKIRLASRSKGKGKSGGFRVVTYYVEQIGDEQTVYLVTIYDKSEEDSIDKDDLLTIVQAALADEPDESSDDQQA